MTDSLTPSSVIKVCGITSPEDARFAVEAGSNALGLNFYSGSPRFISIRRAREIVQHVPAGILIVGVFVNAGEQELVETAEKVGLDVLQLHGDKYPASIAHSFRIWKSVSVARAGVGDGTRAFEAAEGPEAYVLDAPTPHFGGSGTHFDWSLAAAFTRKKIIAGGLDGSNVAAAIRATHPWGVDACSRLESAPGKKDPKRVRDFIHAAMAAIREEVPS